MSNADRFPCGDEVEEPTSTMSTTNDEQGYYSKGIDPDGIIDAEFKRRKEADPRLRKGEDYFATDKQDQRAPMLSETEFMRIPPIPDKYNGADALQWALAHKDEMSGREVIDYYESLITKGVLRVVKKAYKQPMNPIGLHCSCSICNRIVNQMDNFCPGCGAEITKP